MLFLVSCGSPKIQLVDEGGRDYPNPSYVLRSNTKNISVMFYYTAYAFEKDLDGMEIPILTYLPIQERNYLSTKKYKRLFMNIEVQNPTEKEYQLWETVSWKSKDGLQWEHRRRLSYSNRAYRNYSLWLPYDEKYDNVKYWVTMIEPNGQILIDLGNFVYSID